MVVVVPRGRDLVVSELLAHETNFLSLDLKTVGHECVTKIVGSPSFRQFVGIGEKVFQVTSDVGRVQNRPGNGREERRIAPILPGRSL